MKKFLSILFLSLLLQVSIAQAPLNKTVFDCDGNSKNIQDVLGTGKALIIAHKGVDCSICKNSAKPLQTWASNNKTQVEVWGAMSYTYNPNNFKPECQKTKDWDSTYAWTDIFAFADSSRSWAVNSSPRYYVYSALDSTIVFQGSSRSVAQDSAINHSTIAVGLEKLDLSKEVSVVTLKNKLAITNQSNTALSLSIHDLNGRLLQHKRTNEKEFIIETTSFPLGIVILQLVGDDGRISNMKLLMF